MVRRGGGGGVSSSCWLVVRGGVGCVVLSSAAFSILLPRCRLPLFHSTDDAATSSCLLLTSIMCRHFGSPTHHHHLSVAPPDQEQPPPQKKINKSCFTAGDVLVYNNLHNMMQRRSKTSTIFCLLSSLLINQRGEHNVPHQASTIQEQNLVAQRYVGEVDGLYGGPETGIY